MSVNVINSNKSGVFFSKDGLKLDGYNLDKFHPNSNVNQLLVYLEDGGMANSMAMINYQSPNMAQNSSATTSHWYPLFLIGMTDKRVANESAKRTFAQYITNVPPNILNLNLGKATPMTIKGTVKIVGGLNFLGLFESIETLQLEYPASEELDNEYAIAGIEDEEGNVEFYQVDEISEGTYAWIGQNESSNPILSLIESKQYNEFDLIVQTGRGNATPLPLAVQHYQILWQAINNQGNELVALKEEVEAVETLYQNTVQSVEDTNSIDLTLTSDLPNGKKLKADLKVDPSLDNLIKVSSSGTMVDKKDIEGIIDNFITITEEEVEW